MTSSSEDSTHISAAERSELLALRDSEELRRDMRALSARRAARRADMDGYIRFATILSRMSDHARRPPRRIIERDMRL